MENKIGFIIMPIFKDSIRLPKYLGSIINWGVVQNNIITYLTKDGNISTDINKLDSSLQIKYLNDFDLKDSLSSWIKRDGKNKNQSKEFIWDDTIDTGEVYTQYAWIVKVMIVTTDTQVKCKLILN